MHQGFLQQAVVLAELNVASGQGGPYGALIVKQGQVLAASGNLVTKSNDPTAHAEITAIRLACQKLGAFQLTGCALYTSCEPCPMCLGAIYWARLDEVFFAATRQDAADAQFDDSFIYQQIALPPTKRSIPMRHISLPDRLQPFAAWLNNQDRVRY